MRIYVCEYECARASCRYIFIHVAKVQRAALCSQRGVNFFGDRVSFYTAIIPKEESDKTPFSKLSHRVVVLTNTEFGRSKCHVLGSFDLMSKNMSIKCLSMIIITMNSL